MVWNKDSTEWGDEVVEEVMYWKVTPAEAGIRGGGARPAARHSEGAARPKNLKCISPDSSTR